VSIQDDVISVLTTVLGIEERAHTLDASTPLLGSLPELDSLAVVEVIAALDQRFGIAIEDDEVTGEMFETVGSLTKFVESKLG
jgi:acyl carrier protein